MVAIFGLAVLLRFGWLAVNSDSIPFAGLAEANGNVAHNIVSNGRWFVQNHARVRPGQGAAPTTDTGRLVDPADLDDQAADRHPRYRQSILEPPGPAVLLAGIWSITGDQRFIYLQALQLLIDSSMVFLVYWLSLKLLKRPRAALLASVLYAIYLPLIQLARIPHGDAWAGFTTISALALYVKARESDHAWRWLAAMGTVIGVGAYFRPTVLVLPIAFALAAIPWSGWRRAAAIFGVPSLLAALLLLPWTIRNYEVFHALVPVRTSLGWTMWVGLGELPNGFGAKGTDANAVATVRREHPRYPIGTPKFDHVLLTKSLSAIRAHPFFYGELVGRRLLDSTLVPTPTATTRSSQLLRLLSFAQPALFLLALITGIATFRSLPAQRPNLALLAALVVATLLPFDLIHLEARFILATSFVYMILAAYGITQAAAWQRGRAGLDPIRG